MIDKSKLIDSLQNLKAELSCSGKSDTADFFNNSMVSITAETNQTSLKKLLEQICSSGSMTQYASFTFKEEQLFDECFDEAKKLLSVI